MSSSVNINTDTSSNDKLIIGAGAAAGLLILYNYGLKLNTVGNIFIACMTILVALLMWYIYTAPEKLTKFILEQQLLAVISCTLIAAGVFFADWQILGAKQLMGSS